MSPAVKTATIYIMTEMVADSTKGYIPPLNSIGTCLQDYHIRHPYIESLPTLTKPFVPIGSRRLGYLVTSFCETATYCSDTG